MAIYYLLYIIYHLLAIIYYVLCVYYFVRWWCEGCMVCLLSSSLSLSSDTMIDDQIDAHHQIDDQIDDQIYDRLNMLKCFICFCLFYLSVFNKCTCKRYALRCILHALVYVLSE